MFGLGGGGGSCDNSFGIWLGYLVILYIYKTATNVELRLPL
jgi:hypothetical protein